MARQLREPLRRNSNCLTTSERTVSIENPIATARLIRNNSRYIPPFTPSNPCLLLIFCHPSDQLSHNHNLLYNHTPITIYRSLFYQHSTSSAAIPSQKNSARYAKKNALPQSNALKNWSNLNFCVIFNVQNVFQIAIITSLMRLTTAVVTILQWSKQ